MYYPGHASTKLFEMLKPIKMYSFQLGLGKTSNLLLNKWPDILGVCISEKENVGVYIGKDDLLNKLSEACKLKPRDAIFSHQLAKMEKY